MKKNVMMRIASVLLIAVLISTCGISGTYAKYISSASNSATARVAKWAFNVGDSNIAQTNTFVFEPFKYADANVDVNGSNDSEYVIAPGTSGQFKIELKNNSEVTATFSIDFAESRTASDNGNVIPMQYSLDGTAWVDSIDELDMKMNTVSLAMNGGETTVTIHWKWAFDGPDHIDTDLGQDYDGVPNVTISAIVTAQQVD